MESVFRIIINISDSGVSVNPMTAEFEIKLK